MLVRHQKIEDGLAQSLSLCVDVFSDPSVTISDSERATRMRMARDTYNVATEWEQARLAAKAVVDLESRSCSARNPSMTWDQLQLASLEIATGRIADARFRVHALERNGVQDNDAEEFTRSLERLRSALAHHEKEKSNDTPN